MVIKILCICNGGNVRSAALARHIRDSNGQFINFQKEQSALKYEAISIGVHSTSEETLKYLIDWADKVIDLSGEDEEMQELIKNIAKEKYIRKFIGTDVWDSPRHPHLLERIEKIAEEILNENS